MTDAPAEGNQPRWQPLDPLQRRVLGVLIEKGKTTPDAYPMTVNAIRTGCNQISNRHPKMDLGTDDVQATLDELRQMGSVVEVQGDGRALKYRHLAYDWLGVNKTELAVMAELMLRGQQTVGELRGRAARMEPIASLADLKPILSGLIERGLVISLTPEGRGQMVTHNLYPEGEAPEPVEAGFSPARPATGANPDALREIREELESLRSAVSEVAMRVDALERRAATG
jgi:uncharacterized protein YceH (UPF0502 family)